MDELAMILEGMSPEQRQQLLGLGVIDEEQALLQQQMAMADALRQGSGQQYTSPFAAAVGGLGDVVGNISGAVKQKGLMDDLQANVGRRVEGRDAFVQAQIDELRKRRAAAMPGVMAGLTDPRGGVIAPMMGGGR